MLFFCLYRASLVVAATRACALKRWFLFLSEASRAPVPPSLAVVAVAVLSAAGRACTLVRHGYAGASCPFPGRNLGGTREGGAWH